MSFRRRLPNLLSFSCCIASFLVLLGGSADADELALPSAPSAGSDPSAEVELESAPLATFHHYAHTLHELTERRRSTVHFQNQQSILRGVQVGFVNVGDGNLSFARRDLVVVGLLPMVIARVYDSSAGDAGDFGPGWRLSIAETISLQGDGSALLLDESGSVRRFVEHDGQYLQDIPHPSDIVSLERRDGHIFLMKLASGISKRFRLLGGQFRLSDITDRNGNSIRLHYRQGRLARLEGMNERFVLLERDQSGRIAKVTDEQGRSAAYDYNPQGGLVQVLDLGGNAWTYTYGADGRLDAALDPLRYVDFSVQYAEDGRVVEVIHRGQKTRYEYAGNTSRMIDNRDRASTFTQNELGITIAVRNHVGVTTAVELDDANRVSELHRISVTKAAFSYDDHGRLVSSRLRTDDGLQTIAYDYDGAGRLISAIDDAGDLHLSLRYDPRGNVRLVERGEERSAYRYAPDGALQGLWRPDGSHYLFETDADGQITKVTDQEGQTIELSYLPTGRLEKVLFADATTHTYGYSELGLRDFTQPSDAKLLRSYYDASGNLNLLEHVSSSGDIQSDHYDFDETNRLNRVDYVRSLEGDTTSNARELTYDAAGEVVAERVATKDLRFSYDAQDRLVAVADGAKRLVYSYAEDEADIRLQLDAETRVNLLPWASSGITIGASNEIIHNRVRLAPYQTIWLDTDLNVFRLVSDFALTLPHKAIEDSLRWMRLLELGNATFTDKAQFSRPSNVLFVPGEFRWINCYTPPFPPPERCKGIVVPPNSTIVHGSSEADLEGSIQCGGVGKPPCAFLLNVMSADNFLISAAPKMPRVTATATSIIPSSATISWSAKLTHTVAGSCTGGPTFSSTDTASGPSASFAWNGFHGGQLEVTATCSATNYNNGSKTNTENVVKGVQPNNSTITSYIGTVASPFDSADLRRVACWESSLTQFSGGLPFAGPGGDVGIMQICFQRTSNDVWNWKVNVDKGRSIFNTSKNSAKNYLDGEVAGGATAYSSDMWRREGIHRYNAGTTSADMYWEWNGSRWIVVDRGGAGGYVSNVTAQSASCT